MKQLVITYDENGNIVKAGVHDIQNVATYETDGYLVYEDGRFRPLQPTTALYDPNQPWTMDLLTWWRYGKYYVDPETQEVYEAAEWEPPDLSAPAPPPPLFEEEGGLYAEELKG